MSAAPPPAVALSVVVPAFDESARIAGPLRALAGHVAGAAGGAEIVVVDDGSRDGTAALVARLAPELPVPVRVLRSEVNRGKGHALRAGFAASRGERVLFTDADLSTPIAALTDLEAALARGADFAVGSRRLPGSEIRVHQPLLRELLGRGFTALVRLWIADVSDVTCGFKLFRGEAGRTIFARLRMDGWSFDAELFEVARRLGYRHAEVPVVWEDRESTKVRLPGDVARTAWALLRIRWNGLRGRYGAPGPPARAVPVWPPAEAGPGGV